MVTSLDSLLQLIPDGFTKMEDRLKQAVKLLEDEMARMVQEHSTLRDQVFGSSTLLPSWKNSSPSPVVF
jgi:hypothetical protein